MCSTRWIESSDLGLLDVGRHSLDGDTRILLHLALEIDLYSVLPFYDAPVDLTESQLLQPLELARVPLAHVPTGGREVDVESDLLRDLLLLSFGHRRRTLSVSPQSESSLFGRG